MQKVLFISDFHLGAPNDDLSKEREKKICHFLDQNIHQTDILFLVGDIFDFWFEYKTVVPKGYYRFFGKLIEWSDLGKEIHFFTGNHDMWMKDFFEKEFNLNIHYEPKEFIINNTKILVGHGDGLGPKDYKYKTLKFFFKAPFFQYLFQWIHPDIGVKLASYLSRRSRKTTGNKDDQYFGNENEWLYVFCKEYLEKNPNIQYFIFGHRHLPIYQKIEHSESYYINLGDWISFNTFAQLSENQLNLLQYQTTKENQDFSYN